MTDKIEASLDRGPLKLNPWGRWEIRSWHDNGHVRPLAELSSGDVVFVDVGGEMKRTRIEFDHASKRYVSIHGYRLADGIEAALPNG